MKQTLTSLFLLLLLLLLASAVRVEAGPLLDAIEGMDDGRIRFSFETRPGVYGNGRGHVVIHDGGIRSHWGDDDGDWYEDVEPGPARVSVVVRDGELRRIRTRVGGRWRAAREDTIELGDLAPQLAADELMALAERERASVAEDALFAATLAEDVVLWPRLLEIARDDRRSEDLRESAIFWLGQAAGEKAIEGLQRIVDDDDEELELREQAVFALSQQPARISVPRLSRVAQSSPHPQLRQAAFFWLAQHDDPRVLALFEDVLLGR